MRKIYCVLCCFIIASCIKNEKVRSNIITEEKINQWEIATYDTIANLFDRNRNNKTDSFELSLLKNHYLDLYNHQARRYFSEQLKRDTIFLNAHIDKCTIVEHSNMESYMDFMIFYKKMNTNICLLYKLGYVDDTNTTKKVFVLDKKVTINSAKFEAFIQKVRMSNLFKNENNNGESYNGEIVVSILSKDKLEVFPYLTFNFSNEVYKTYNEMFK